MWPLFQYRLGRLGGEVIETYSNVVFCEMVSDFGHCSFRGVQMCDCSPGR